MKNTIKLPLGENRVSAEVIVKLMVIGALRVGENGLCAGEVGVYETKNGIHAPLTKA